VTELFKCPAWAATDATHYQSILSNITPWRDSKGVSHYPFGNPDKKDTRPPMTLTMISQYPLARTWMLVDMDNPLMTQLGWGTSSDLPQKTIHGSSRNVLFFDGHVTAVPDSTPLTLVSVP
jgi:prepilin-type processing-associated H-X9-DG protein